MRGFALHIAPDLPFLAKYPDAARLLWTGELPVERLLDFSPLYLSLATGLAAVGLEGPAPLVAIQTVWGVAVCLGAAGIAGRWDGRLAALAAGLIAALAHQAVVLGVLLEPGIWLAGLLLLGVLAWPGDRIEGGLPRIVVSGLCFGLAALARPTALMAPVFLLALDRNRRSLAALAVAVGISGIGLALWLGPLPPGQWRVLMSPGQVFHQGNAADARGYGPAYPSSVEAAVAAAPRGPDLHHAAYRWVARGITGECLSPVATESFWRGLVWKELRRNPLRASERPMRRLRDLFALRQVWDLPGGAVVEEELAVIAPVSIAFLLPLSMVALVTRSRRDFLPLLVVLLIPVTTIAGFYLSARHRGLLEILLIPLAGVGLASVLELVRNPRRWRSANWGWCLAVVITAVLLVFWPRPRLERSREAVRDMERGEALLRLAERSAVGGAPVEVRRELLAEAVTVAPGLMVRLPPEWRDRELEARIRREAWPAAATGRERALYAYLQAGGDCARVLRLAPTRDESSELSWFRAACALRLGRSDLLARILPAAENRRLDGWALTAAAEISSGVPVEIALRRIPSVYDRFSVLLEVAGALAVSGEEETATRLRSVVHRKLLAARRCQRVFRGGGP
ncbi:MAG: hypothetical protein R3234_08390 [Thermoanaerobaculia bacterium]|nr:hypothetical protein [Thermoanaerobaculia bacterium]